MQRAPRATAYVIGTRHPIKAGPFFAARNTAMHDTMDATRRWSLWGVLAGALLGLGDLLAFLSFGLEMRWGGRSVMTEVMILFMVTYGGLGFVIGKLMEARAQARADARTIASQLRALEASRRLALQNEKLAAIGRLAAGIAHEVRNPLGVIRASASMVRDHFTAGEEAYRACDFIREEIDRLNGLITALLNFARPAELRLQPIAIDHVIDKALHLTSEELQRRGITLTRESAGTLPLVLADPDLVAQVLLGVLVNAAEAIERDGAITVRTISGSHEVGVEVLDTGPGIPLAKAEQVFEPFFTTKPTGTGLGLPMAARIMQAHGGTIEVVMDGNAPDQHRGARFRIRLPLQGPTVNQRRAA